MDEQFHFLLMQTFNLTNRMMQQEAARLGLDPGQPKILQVLYPDLEMAPGKIAKICRMDKSTATNLIHRMVSKGLLIRKKSSRDARSILVTLSEEGKEKAAAVIETGRLIDKQILSGFSKEEIQRLKADLVRIQENMQKREASEKL